MISGSSMFSPQVPSRQMRGLLVSYISYDHIRVNIITDLFFTVIQSLNAIMIRVLTALINKYCPRLTRTALTFTAWGRVPYIRTNTAEKSM
jgi:hypothetical protein